MAWAVGAAALLGLLSLCVGFQLVAAEPGYADLGGHIVGMDAELEAAVRSVDHASADVEGILRDKEGRHLTTRERAEMGAMASHLSKLQQLWFQADGPRPVEVLRELMAPQGPQGLGHGVVPTESQPAAHTKADTTGWTDHDLQDDDDTDADDRFYLGETQEETAVTFAEYKQIPKAVVSDDNVFLKFASGKILETEGTKIVARGQMHALPQSFVIEGEAAGAIKGGDAVYIKSTLTGKYISVADSTVHAAALQQTNALKFEIEKRVVTAGVATTVNTAIEAGDTVYLKAPSTNYVFLDGEQASALSSATVSESNSIVIEKEGVKQAYCCSAQGVVNFLDLNGDGTNGLTTTRADCEAKCKANTDCKFFEVDPNAASGWCTGFSACPKQCSQDLDGARTIFELKAQAANIAAGMNTTQASTKGSADSSRAVDGNTQQDFSQNSCTATQAQFNPWWRVDLVNSTYIGDVTVWSRSDCCGGRLSNFDVRVGDSASWADNLACGTGLSIRQGGSLKVDCAGKQGRYVYVDIRGRTDILSLCEVHVSSTAAPPAAPLVEELTFAPLASNSSSNFTKILQPDMLLINMTMAPLYLADTQIAGFENGIKVGIAMSSGFSIHSEQVQVLAILPITSFVKGEIVQTTNDTDPLAGIPAPSVQVNCKLLPIFQGGPTLAMKDNLIKNKKSGYLAGKIQEQVEAAGVEIKPYKAAWLDELTIIDMNVTNTSTKNLTCVDMGCTMRPVSTTLMGKKPGDHDGVLEATPKAKGKKGAVIDGKRADRR